MSYNGWKNYETWNVVLWVMNDEPMYRAMRDCRKKQQFAGGVLSDNLEHKFTAKTARKFVESVMPHGTPDFQERADGLPQREAAYDVVSWREVARAFNE